MAYDEQLAARIRDLAAGRRHVEEKQMFGGLAFLVGGHMAIAASGNGGILVRVDPAETEALTGETHARPAEMRGRLMDGWLRVDAERLATDDELRPWVERGLAYAASLEPKRQ